MCGEVLKRRAMRAKVAFQSEALVGLGRTVCGSIKVGDDGTVVQVGLARRVDRGCNSRDVMCRIMSRGCCRDRAPRSRGSSREAKTGEEGV